MGGGKKAQASTPPSYNGIQVQSSIAGKAIPLGWGTFRIPASLLWYDNFKSIAHESTQSSGGKGGGGGKVTTTTYTYTASVIMGLCQGPITQIRTVYKDKNVWTASDGSAPTQAGLSVALGALGQSTWGYLTTNYPDAAIGYSGIAYVYAADYDLGNNAVLNNHSFEIQSTTRVSGLDDANPKDIISDFLPQVPFWPSGIIADLTTYGNYCLAAQLLLSPVLDSQRTAADIVNEWLAATNSAAVWSEGKLKIIPYGDTTCTANSTTYTPDLTPIYDLTDDDFIPSADGDDPIIVNLKRPADAYNYLQVEFLDRTHQYNTQVVPGVDQGSIDQFGKRAAPNPYSMHSICDPDVASRVAQILVQRTSSIRCTYKFRLGPHYILLDPMDLVTLTTGDLDHVLVRITDIKEDASTGEYDVEAEEMLVGMGHPATFSRQTNDGSIFTHNNTPGSIAEYILFCPPTALNVSGREVWVGASGAVADWGGAEVWASFDNVKYRKVGIITSPTRFGITTDTIPNVTDPDTTTTFHVDSSATHSVFLNGTVADHDNATTLFLVNGELMAYQNASLVSADHYSFNLLRRGLYGTTAASHSSGAKLVRLDDALIKLEFQPEQDGSTLYVKFVSFNTFGFELEDISTVTAQTVSLVPGDVTIGDTVPPVDITSAPTITLQQGHDAGGNSFAYLDISWAADTTDTDLQGYVVEVSDPTGTVDFISSSASYQVRGLVGGDTYSVKVKALDTSGNLSVHWSPTTSINVGAGPSDRPNLVFNGGLSLGTQQWTITPTSSWGSSKDGIIGYFFETILGGTNTTESAEFPVTVGLPYTVSLIGGGRVPTAGHSYIDIEWFDSSHAHLSYSAGRTQLAELGVGEPYVLSTLTQTAPSSAAFARVRVYTESVTWASGGFLVITQVKAEQSSTYTGFNDAATNGAQYNDGTDINSLKPLDSGATRNTIFRSNTTPTATGTGDWWVVLDGSGNAIAIKQWNGTSWVTPADLTSVNIASGITGQSFLATGNPAIGGNANRLRFTDFEGAGGVLGWADGGNPSSLTRSKTTTTSNQVPLMDFQATATAAGQFVSVYTEGDRFQVTPGEQLASQLIGGSSNSTLTCNMVFFKADGSQLSSSTGFALAANATFPTVGHEMVTVPALAVSAYWAVYITSAASGVMHGKFAQPMVSAVPAGQTAYPTYMRGPSNTAGADVTLVNTAAAISGQGALATLSAATWSTQVTGTGKPADNADVTATHTAAAISGQGSLATQSSATWSTQVTGTGKPADNADVTSTHTAAAISGQGGMATQNFVAGTNITTSVSGANLTVNATGGGGGVLTVSMSGGMSKVVGLTSQPSTQTSSTATASVSGGTANYQYAWSVVSYDGSHPCSLTNPSTTTSSTSNSCAATTQMIFAESSTLTARCTVVDANGKIGFADATGGFTDSNH